MTSTVLTTAGAGAGTARSTLGERIASQIQRRGALAVLVLVVAIASATSSTFPTWSNISSILGNNAFVWLLALGMTFVIITGGID
ncbi:MAG: galactofuranose transport system permease protein, partial [Streptosporangiaceae bacterium]|nr:galactofuranose transport system permease protein [Streptosporangiaceae bacterium]